jgi:hypothetical protein
MLWNWQSVAHPWVEVGSDKWLEMRKLNDFNSSSIGDYLGVRFKGRNYGENTRIVRLRLWGENEEPTIYVQSMMENGKAIEKLFLETTASYRYYSLLQNESPLYYTIEYNNVLIKAISGSIGVTPDSIFYDTNPPNGYSYAQIPIEIKTQSNPNGKQWTINNIPSRCLHQCALQCVALRSDISILYRIYIFAETFHIDCFVMKIDYRQYMEDLLNTLEYIREDATTLISEKMAKCDYWIIQQRTGEGPIYMLPHFFNTVYELYIEVRDKK